MGVLHRGHGPVKHDLSYDPLGMFTLSKGGAPPCGTT